MKYPFCPGCGAELIKHTHVSIGFLDICLCRNCYDVREFKEKRERLGKGTGIDREYPVGWAKCKSDRVALMRAKYDNPSEFMRTSKVALGIDIMFLLDMLDAKDHKAEVDRAVEFLMCFGLKPDECDKIVVGSAAPKFWGVGVLESQLKVARAALEAKDKEIEQLRTDNHENHKHNCNLYSQFSDATDEVRSLKAALEAKGKDIITAGVVIKAHETEIDRLRNGVRRLLDK